MTMAKKASVLSPGLSLVAKVIWNPLLRNLIPMNSLSMIPFLRIKQIRELCQPHLRQCHCTTICTICDSEVWSQGQCHERIGFRYFCSIIPGSHRFHLWWAKTWWPQVLERGGWKMGCKSSGLMSNFVFKSKSWVCFILKHQCHTHPGLFSNLEGFYKQHINKIIYAIYPKWNTKKCAGWSHRGAFL